MIVTRNSNPMVLNRITAQSDEGATVVGGKSDPSGVSERTEGTEPTRGALSGEAGPMDRRSARGISKKPAEVGSFPPSDCVLWLVLPHKATAGQIRAIHRGGTAFAPILVDTLAPTCRGAFVRGVSSLSAGGSWPTGVRDRDGLSVCFPAPLATFPDPSPACTISLRTLPTGFEGFGACDAGGKGIVTFPC